MGVRFAIAIILLIVLLIIAVVGIGFRVSTRHWQHTASPQQHLRNLWFQVDLLLLFTVEGWEFMLTSPSRWLVVVFAVLSILQAVLLVSTVTNWHGWGKRLAFPQQLLYRRPRNPRLVFTVLIAAPLALLSDVVLLVVLLVR